MYTEINLIAVKRIITELSSCEAKLKKEYYELMNVIADLRRIEEEGIRITCRKLEGQKSVLYCEIRKTQSLTSILEKILNTYQRTETETSDFDPYGKIISLNDIFKVLKDMKPLYRALDTANIRFE